MEGVVFELGVRRQARRKNRVLLLHLLLQVFLVLFQILFENVRLLSLVLFLLVSDLVEFRLPQLVFVCLCLEVGRCHFSLDSLLSELGEFVVGIELLFPLQDSVQIFRYLPPLFDQRLLLFFHAFLVSLG